MFSGIVECQGSLISSTRSGSNVRLHIHSPFLEEVHADQSIAHNGVCLTVTGMDNLGYYVDVIEESLKRSNLAALKPGDRINLERSLTLNQRLDGHIVQGHVDQTAIVDKVDDRSGSWTIRFRFTGQPGHVLIDKGSICVNGVSLTISGLHENYFEVSVIPYTFSNTNLGLLREGDQVNIEFDVVGKYVERLIRT